MWRHYQERHNHETSGFVCPYTNCGTIYEAADNLVEHIESSHRQPLKLPIEPEIICYEGLDNSIDDETNQNEEDCYFKIDSKNQQLKIESLTSCSNGYSLSSNNDYTNSDEYSSKDDVLNRSDGTSYHSEEYSYERKKITATSKADDYHKSNDTATRVTSKSHQNENVSIIHEDFVIKYDSRSSQYNEMLHDDNDEQSTNVLYINGDVTITKNLKIQVTNQQGQEHRIDLGNLEKVFRSGFERDSPTIETKSNIEINSSCHDDEEYTPKKQRMSRYKQEAYKCGVDGCGKTYKYISHYRHHQDSHKLVSNTMSTKVQKAVNRPKSGKASTVSFFL